MTYERYAHTTAVQSTTSAEKTEGCQLLLIFFSLSADESGTLNMDNIEQLNQ
jgi:hypothetical protein